MFAFKQQNNIKHLDQQCPYKIKLPDFTSMRITPPLKLQPIKIQPLIEHLQSQYQSFPIQIFQILGVGLEKKQKSIMNIFSCMELSCNQCKAISNETLIEINSRQAHVKRRDSYESDKQTTGMLQHIEEGQQQNTRKLQYLKLWKKYKKKGHIKMKFDYAYIQFGHLQQKQWIQKIQKIFQ